MTRQAAFSVHVSTAVHVSGLVVFACSSFLAEVPHYHVYRGVVTIQGSFAVPQPTSETYAVSLTPISESEPARLIESVQMAPAATEIRRVRTTIETSLTRATLPAAMEDCDCEADEHVLLTPKRSLNEEPMTLVKIGPPPLRRAEPVPEFTVATDIALPSSPLPTGTDFDEPPRKSPSNLPPPYPPDAYQRGQQGRVVLEIRVTPDGTVVSLRIVESSGVASLDQAALEAVRAWRFEPARRRGQPVEAVVNVPVRFSIRG
jgi:periplasmic protein TonB